MNKEITFTEAATILLDEGGKIMFTADNNQHPEEYGYYFTIDDFQCLCEEYKQLYIKYYNIKLFKF